MYRIGHTVYMHNYQPNDAILVAIEYMLKAWITLTGF